MHLNMRTYWTAVLFILIPFFLMGQDIPKRPSPPRLVNDFAGVLSKSQEKAIENKLVLLDKQNSTQVAVVIVNSTGKYSTFEYATEIGDQWQVGNAKLDNGVVLLVAVKDRKTFIATGRGSEGWLPDLLTNRIVENYLLPNFKKGDYFAGIDQATDVIAKLATGEYGAKDVKGGGGSSSKRKVPGVVFFIVIGLFFLFSLFNRGRHGRGGGFYGGGFYGGGGGFSGGGGGFSGGGGSSFGGFGGGSFGGGGSGGSW